MGVRLVVGLGNPGRRYRATRHNVGFCVVDRLTGGRYREGSWGHWTEMRLGDDPVLVLRPLTYMNLSGIAVRHCVNQHGLHVSEVMVVHDHMDLPLGRLRVRPRGGSGGHKGVRSVASELNSTDFARLRVGIGRPPEGTPSENHVLSSFMQEEVIVVREVVEVAVKAVRTSVTCGLEEAMNLYNGCDLREQCPE